MSGRMQGDEFSVASANDVAIADRRPFDQAISRPAPATGTSERATAKPLRERHGPRCVIDVRV